MARSNLRICLMMEQLDFGETYLDIVWRSSIHEAQDSGAQLVVMAGQFIGTNNLEERAQASIFRLIMPADFDGFILCGTAFNMVTRETLQHFRQELPAIKGISTTHRLPGLSSVMVDNESGLRELVRHLIRFHGYTRIACIRGPLHHDEADTRFRVWQEEVEAAGLTASRDLLVFGHFNYNKSLNVFADLLNLPGGLPQAVVACTDDVAIQLTDELSRHGWRVPEDIAVVGFDNIARGLYLASPLSTVNQPIEGTVAAAFHWLNQAIRSEQAEVVQDIILGSQAVIRSSCGCVAKTHHTMDSGDILPRLESDQHAIETILQKGMADKSSPAIIRAVVSKLHREYWDVLYLLNSFNEFVRATALIGSINQLAPALHKWLPELGIRHYCVSVCCSETGQFEAFAAEPVESAMLADAPQRFLLIAAEPRPEAAVEGGTVFAAGHLAPPGWLDSVSPAPQICLPLTVGGHWYGLIVLEIQNQDSIVYRSIQNHLSTILDREYRLARMVDITIQEQARTRSEQEKLHALSSLVRGMAHEMNTPLGVGITSSSFLISRADELAAALSGPGLAKDVLDRFITDVVDTNGLIQRNLERTAKLVNLFKDVAVAESLDAPESFDLVAFLVYHSKTLRQEPGGLDLEIRLDVPERLMVNSRPESFRRILTQLLTNAGLSLPPGQEKVTVRITLTLDPDNSGLCNLEFTDNGCGMEPSEISHIFEPFYTTWRMTGHVGLGLHMVWNIVTHLLGGTILCRSRRGQGTRFILQFPLNAPDV